MAFKDGTASRAQGGRFLTALVLVDAQTNRPKGLITEADLVQLMADGRGTQMPSGSHELMATRLSVIKATASDRFAASATAQGVRCARLPSSSSDWTRMTGFGWRSAAP